MLNSWFDKIANALDPAGSADVTLLDVEQVSATLLVEIARADHEIEPQERQAIVTALSRCSSLESSEIESVVGDALSQADSTVSLHEHVRIVNEHFDKPGKLALVEQMWRVAVADGNIDRYEEYTIRKLCDLLFIKHRDFMQAKLKVVEEQDENMAPGFADGEADVRPTRQDPSQ